MLSLREVLKASAALVVLMISVSAICEAGTVDILPGANLPALVNAAPAGTTFIIHPGTYRLASPIVPKNGDIFSGQAGAILSGARLLTTFTASGSYHMVTGQTQQGRVTIDNSICDTGYPRCNYPEDLFFDNKPLIHMDSLGGVAAGKWFFDYTANIIYFADSPTGHTVETSVQPAAFQGTANNVTIQGLIIEKFAAPVMTGAISGAGTAFGNPASGANWVIQNNEIRYNHADGIRINFGFKVNSNKIHDNGNLAIGGGVGGGNADGTGTQQSNIVIQGNEMFNNNYAHFKPHYGAGGSKFFMSRGMVFRNNYVHNNLGVAMHLDTGNYGALYDGNTVADNSDEGIMHEISFAATVRNNKLLRNGYIYPDGSFWLYAANLLSATSQSVTAYCNTVEVAAEGGNGINILTQHRTGYIPSISNYYHHNTVVFDGNSGNTGGARGDATITNFFSSNKFDYNTYHMPLLTRKAFAWNDKMNTFAQFQAAGQEVHGTADTNYKNPIPTVHVTAPAMGATVSGLVDITGTVTATVATKVDLYVDWVLKQSTTGTPFAFTWNASTVTPGAHLLAAMVHSATGTQSCYAVPVNVQ
jgi:Bacterial Ig domain/Right handed beta helix region